MPNQSSSRIRNAKAKKQAETESTSEKPGADDPRASESADTDADNANETDLQGSEESQPNDPDSGESGQDAATAPADSD